MAQQRALPQSKETLLQSYNKRLKDDVKSIMDNFTEIIKTAKVRAGESLMKLVSDLKQFLILNDFPSVNEAIDQRNQQLRALQEECDRKLITLRDEVSIDLYELEEEYYSSRGLATESNGLWGQSMSLPQETCLLQPACPSHVPVVKLWPLLRCSLQQSGLRHAGARGFHPPLSFLCA
ncbi:mediator of RNA polymerase II transcription subunit 22 isoform X3 [Marmota monax]|nr:mediator of RNA polymerase II transcription subunit 22 isoform X3 [Marmota monax]